MTLIELAQWGWQAAWYGLFYKSNKQQNIMTSLKTLAYNYKKAHPQAAIADFINYIIENKQNSEAGDAIAKGFWKALEETGTPGKGSYRFS